MTLKDHLYRILTADHEARCFEIALLADCVIYRAHFPERPVTPGVCIIQTATELLGELTGSSPELVGVANAKYLAVIDPLQTPSVTYCFRKIQNDDENGTFKVSAEVRGTDTVYTKLSLIYKR